MKCRSFSVSKARLGLPVLNSGPRSKVPSGRATIADLLYLDLLASYTNGSNLRIDGDLDPTIS
jgi:hypothetical protein